MGELTLTQIAADPFVQTGVLAVAGALITRLLLRHYPARRLVFQLAFFLALTALLFHHDIVPYEIAPDTTPAFERIFVALAKIIWWVNAAWVLTGFTRVFLIFERRPREGRLIQDLVVGVIYLGAALSVVAYVFNAPVGTLIATSGVFAIILGLALQSTLTDVFSGHRPQSQQGLRGRRLDRAERRLRRPCRGDQLAGDPSAQRLERSRRAAQQRPGQGAAHQSQQPQPHPRGEAARPRGADQGAVGDFRRHAHRAAEQQFHHARAPAHGGDQVARRAGDRVRAVVPRQGLRGGVDRQARGLRPDLSPYPGGGAGAGPAAGGLCRTGRPAAGGAAAARAPKHRLAAARRRSAVHRP